MSSHPSSSIWQGLVFAVLVSLVSGPGCGNGGSKTDALDGAVRAVESRTKPALDTWAGRLATRASEQVHSAGSLDLDGLAADATRSANSVTEPACEAIHGKKSIAKTRSPSIDGSKRLSEFVDLQTIKSLGRFPLVLYASRTPWPQSWLQESAMLPTYQEAAAKVDPLFLKSILQDRFVGSDGAFVPPEPGNPDYPTLTSWLKQDGNSFDVLVFSLTKSVNSGIGDCLRQEVGKS